MEKLHKLEMMVASWYENAPHLPENNRIWIARNVWWLTLVGVILGGVGAAVALIFLATGAAVLGAAGVLTPEISGAILIASFLTITFMVANVVVAAVAIAPLKGLRKLGWSLLFIAAIINVASLVVTFFFNFNFFGLAYGLVFAAVGGYFLFEIRSYFHEAKSIKKPAAQKSHKA